MKFSTAIAAFALAATFEQVDATKCYVLALSAGEETAAYQAGAFKGLVESNSATKYDVVTGVQGGAVNAALIAHYAKGSETAAAARMKTFWDNASNATLFKDWRGGLAQGYAFEGGLYNSSPMETFLTNELSDITSMNRNLNIGITNELSGKMNEFTQSNILFSNNLVESMYASLSNAGFFAPVDAFGSSYYNGSAIWNLDIFSGVEKCLQRHTESEVVIDVILTSTSSLRKVDVSQNTTIYNFARYLQVSNYYSSMNAFLKAMDTYPSATFRYLIAPLKHLPKIEKPLNMSQAEVDEIYTMGENDAKNVVMFGANIELISDYFRLKTMHSSEVHGMSLDEYLDLHLGNPTEEPELIQE